MPFRLVPPRWGPSVTRFVPCSMRCTGRPRPIRDVGFMRFIGKVYRRDVMVRAWAAVRANNGAPGIDNITLAEVEEYGVDRLLGELAEDVRNRKWRPLPARRVFIPKPGSTEQRPLSIPAVRDASCRRP